MSLGRISNGVPRRNVGITSNANSACIKRNCHRLPLNNRRPKLIIIELPIVKAMLEPGTPENNQANCPTKAVKIKLATVIRKVCRYE